MTRATFLKSIKNKTLSMESMIVLNTICGDLKFESFKDLSRDFEAEDRLRIEFFNNVEDQIRQLADVKFQVVGSYSNYFGWSSIDFWEIEGEGIETPSYQGNWQEVATKDRLIELLRWQRPYVEDQWMIETYYEVVGMGDTHSKFRSEEAYEFLKARYYI